MLQASPGAVSSRGGRRINGWYAAGALIFCADRGTIFNLSTRIPMNLHPPLYGLEALFILYALRHGPLEKG